MPSLSSQAVNDLKANLPTSITIRTPESENFQESVKHWATTSEKAAAAVVYPTSAEDVSKIVRFSTAHSVEIVVCGGGHSTGGLSSTEGGICIDLSKIPMCTVDAEKKTISVQGGALWRDVNQALAPHGLAAVGGAINHTGVGGLTLGGGYGWLTPQHGLAIDNLLSVEYVLVDGSIVTASSTENSDLFWAARGAGSAFGVATNFVFQAHDQKHDVWAGLIGFPPSQLKEIIEASNQLVEKCTGRSTHIVAFVSPPPAPQTIIGCMIMYDGSEEEGRKFYEPLLSLKPLMDTTSTMPYVNLNGMQATLAPVETDWAEVVFQDYVKFTTDVPDAKGSMAMIEFISPRKILKVSQTDTAFANRGNYFNIVFSTVWTQPENDSLCRDWSRSMAAKTKEYLLNQMRAGTDAVTKDAVGQYANFAPVGETGQVLFGVNFPRLVKLKKRYDPGNVFGKNLNLL